jgi:branched-chain amino acid transport system substrate-binding protein
VADSIRYVDSTLEVGGLFIPAEAEDVVMLAPQVYFHKIRTQMLGCTGWHAAKTVADGKRYVQNAILSTNLEAGGANERWAEFRSWYMERFRTEPGRVAALGFDAATLMLKAVQETGDASNTKAVAQWIAAVRDYSGASGRITFDQASGANIEAAIVKISDKEFVRIQ